MRKCFDGLCEGKTAKEMRHEFTLLNSRYFGHLKPLVVIAFLIVVMNTENMMEINCLSS